VRKERLSLERHAACLAAAVLGRMQALAERPRYTPGWIHHSPAALTQLYGWIHHPPAALAQLYGWIHRSPAALIQTHCYLD
jgi:hypothetical protein